RAVILMPADIRWKLLAGAERPLHPRHYSAAQRSRKVGEGRSLAQTVLNPKRINASPFPDGCHDTEADESAVADHQRAPNWSSEADLYVPQPLFRKARRRC